MKHFKHLAFLVLSVCNSFVISQNNTLSLDQINGSEMTGSDITALNSDHKGYLWVGTSNGLNRYDGYNFVTYRSYKGDSNSLSHPFIQTINEFSNKELLIGTSNGLNAYSFDKNNFTRIKIDSTLSNYKKKNSILCLTQLKDGNILAGSSDGIMLYDPKTKKLLPFSTTKTTLLEGCIIQSMCLDNTGTLWIGTKQNVNDGIKFRVYNYNPKTKKLNEFALSEYGSVGHVGISLDHKGLIWVAIDDGLMSIDPQTLEKKFYKSPNGFLSNVSYFHSKDGFIYQCYWSFGVTVFDVNKKTYQIIKNNPDNPRSLISNKVWALHKDAYGVVWFGTEVGLQKQSNKRVNIEVIKRNAELSQNTFPSNQLLAVWVSRKEKNKIFVGIDGDGLSIYDRSNKKTENITFGTRQQKKLEERFINQFYESEDGSVYAAGQYNFEKINFSGKSIVVKHYFFQQQHHFTCVFPDYNNKKTLWLGGIGQIIKFDISSEKFEFIKNPANSSDIIYCGLSNKAGSIFTSKNCLLIIDSNQKISRIPIPDAGNISSIESFDENHVILGTSFLGLIRYDLINNTYEIIKNNRNTFFSEVKCIKKVNNTFWIGTTEGLYQYYPSSHDVQEYGLVDGLPSNIIQDIDYFEGHLYLATTNGLVVFNLRSVAGRFTVPKIDITSIIGIGNDMEVISDLNNKTIEIPQSKNSFKINFTVLDFNLPEKNSYKYKLLPIQTSWKNNNHDHSVSFNELSEGEYELQIIGANSDNIWNTSPLSIKINIIPPFYKSKPFYFALGFLMFALIGVIFYSRYRRIKNNQMYLEKTIQERTEEIKIKQTLLEKSNVELHENNKKIEVAYKTLAISEGKFKQITETINDIFYLYNIQEKKYEYISPNCFSVLGLPQQYFYDGNSSKVVVHKDDMALVVDANVKIDSGISYDIEYRIVVNGKIKWIAEKSSPIYDENETLVRNSGICRDITLKKADEEDIRRKNKDITDSILYAQKIQKAFLVGEKILTQNLPQSFIYFKPKEKVSGDFFWIGRERSYIIIAAGDCTGHGVPGALLSVIGTTLLNKIVHEEKIFTPGKILTELNYLFYHQLTLDDKSFRDGMDISIITVDLKTQKMFFSGARNNGSMITGDTYTEIMAQRETIGENEHVTFDSQEIEYNTDTTYYLYSDGYKDQFGGKSSKKLASKTFKDTLVKASKVDINGQALYFKSFIKDWQGENSQTDDRLIIGFKLR